MDVLDQVRGCLLGGAIGDALGAPIEFQSLREIRRDHGADGITGYVTTWRGRTGLITDDTQMTLFTAEGLLDARDIAAHASAAAGGADGGAREASAGAVRRAYLRWLDTQQHPAPPPADLPHRTGALREERWLYSQRAPGNACLSGLRRPFPGPSAWGRPGPVNPDSKGCGTVMRSAPFGLTGRTPREAFEQAAVCAQITHGHPTGYLAAGAFAAIVAHLMAGERLEPAVHRAMDLLAGYPGHEESSAALSAAVSLAERGDRSPEAVESLGGAWVAEEALAIGVYCALVEPSVERALLLSVNHSGDSDSTGSVCGNLLGALNGAAELPDGWLAPLEGRDTIERLAAELA
ncbi:ADP-ribosylglycohydrolase family protein [Nonomuraea sp. MG754425]|uniref:ADP-ribosylglycohydrolase family protein n=1 Tax=Nonomuraea sp. MG754425 TaxID=2570319 RepID=UPI001F1A4EA2|nr:ADP-ribosylglycohydrolase family protein [Nonomuraea sp. MG754425]MCF6474517.1 ADP-ribosylglycohydrolase family protein [Nonomuraea sp. MG754425]